MHSVFNASVSDIPGLLFEIQRLEAQLSAAILDIQEMCDVKDCGFCNYSDTCEYSELEDDNDELQAVE